MTTPIYYFGCWSGTGHHLWAPDGRALTRNEPLPPSLRCLDGTLCGDPALADHNRRTGALSWHGIERQPQGVARLHHRDGWTALAWWDRSGDARGGSNSAFVAEGTLTAAEVIERGRVAFPTVWRRIEAAGGVRLPGELVTTVPRACYR